MEVSAQTMSTTCTGCHKAIKVEDVVIKTYVPVTEVQTCGTLRITKRGRVVARRITCGSGIVCEGGMEGAVQSDGAVVLGPAATWKGATLRSRSLSISPGAKLLGAITVPWERPEPPAPPPRAPGGSARRRPLRPARPASLRARPGKR
jgi:hypothetical protein